MLADGGNNPALSWEWRIWIAENKLLHTQDADILNVMAENGIPERLARSEIAAVTAHPSFHAGGLFAQRLKKLESLLNIYHELSALSAHSGVERRSAPSREEFLEDYYATNRPVIITDMMSEWKALTRWTPEYLKAACGGETVQIMSGREGDPQYELNSGRHKSATLFRDYVDLVLQAGESNDSYMVANNHFLEKRGARKLYEDIVVFPEYLDGRQLHGYVFFWFGPAGTITPLHHDVTNILMAQVRGRKRVTLVPSSQTHLVYNDVGVYSRVDCENPDYESYPLYQYAQPTEIILEPGEALFIPVGWWHHVRALEMSISVSFTNFLFPNHYEWEHPDIAR